MNRNHPTFYRRENEFWDHLSEPSPLPEGTRVRLIDMSDDPDPIVPGTLGTVTRLSNGSVLSVRWDDGRRLSLLVGVDRYEVIQ